MVIFCVLLLFLFVAWEEMGGFGLFVAFCGLLFLFVVCEEMGGFGLLIFCMLLFLLVV